MWVSTNVESWHISSMLLPIDEHECVLNDTLLLHMMLTFPIVDYSLYWIEIFDKISTENGTYQIWLLLAH